MLVLSATSGKFFRGVTQCKIVIFIVIKVSSIRICETEKRNRMHSTRRKVRGARPDRLEYLSLLVNEFNEVKSKDARRQVTANLANFAFDPSNFVYLRQLGVLDLFLNHLTDPDETVVQFSISGLCNLSLDPKNKAYILQCKGISNIAKLLEHENENISVSAITTLMFLITPESREEITDANIIKSVIILRRGKKKRIKNLAEIFIEDYCSKQQIDSAITYLENSICDIPLPDS